MIFGEFGCASCSAMRLLVDFSLCGLIGELGHEKIVVSFSCDLD
jgi:hypothetical protein